MHKPNVQHEDKRQPMLGERADSEPFRWSARIRPNHARGDQLGDG